MNLYIQIKLILFSFLFGVYFSFMLDVNCKYMKSKSLLYNSLFTIFFMLFNTFLYFYILQNINNGILHYYSFLCIVLGVFIENVIVNKIKR